MLINKFNQILEKRIFIYSLVVGFLLLPYIRTLFFDSRSINFIFCLFFIPMIIKETFNKEFIKNNKSILLYLLLFFSWILLGITYSPSREYVFEKAMRGFLLVFLFLLPVIIKDRKLFIKTLLYSSVAMILIALFKFCIQVAYGIKKHIYDCPAMDFSRLTLVIYLLLFLYPLFKNKHFNNILLFVLFSITIFFQCKGVMISLIISIMYLFIFHEKKKFLNFFKKNLLIKLCSIIILISTLFYIIENYDVRYKRFNFSLLNLDIVNSLYIHGKRGNQIKYSFDDKNGLLIEGNKFFIHKIFPFALFKSKNVFALVKMVSNSPHTHRIHIYDGNKSSYSDFHPGDGQEKILIVNHPINNKSSSIDVRFLDIAPGPSTKVSIKGIEVMDGLYRNGRILLKTEFSSNSKNLMKYLWSDLSIFDRVTYLSASISLIFDNLLKFSVGWGTSSYSFITFNLDSRRYPHNFIIELLIENGLIGLMLYFAFLAACFVRLKKEYIPLFLALILVDMFSSSYSEAKFLFFFLGFYCLKQSDKFSHFPVDFFSWSKSFIAKLLSGLKERESMKGWGKQER